MKKLIILLSLSSCTPTINRIYYPANIKQCVHNLNEMQRWLLEDYESGDIPRHVADSYSIVIINTKQSLLEKHGKKRKNSAN